MNIEVFREYCLSLGDVEEKLPFAKMPGGDSVLTTKGICPPDSHFNAKYWIGLEVQVIETELLKELVANSYEIVRTKNKKKTNK